MPRRVLIIQEHLPHYRVPFFDGLKESLAAVGVRLDLVCNQRQASQYVAGGLSWATPVRMPRWRGLVWHCDTLRQALASDLVIAPQEVKYLVPLLAWVISRMTRTRFAFWGHGKNFQARNSNSITERLKRLISRRVDWWFAYNDLSAGVVRDVGFPPARITTVGNAIDTTSLHKRRQSLDEAELAAIRAELRLRSDNVAVYTGGLYPNKRIGLLIDAAILIRQQLPDFELIVIGDGSERWRVSAAAAEHPWIHDVGQKDDNDKVPYWALSKLLLMPGGVGLVVLDAFALGVPIVTTETHLHGPEFDYLENGVNGWVVGCGESAQLYASAVVELLLDPERLEQLRQGALAAAPKYSIEKMVANFTAGINRALDRSP